MNNDAAGSSNNQTPTKKFISLYLPLTISERIQERLDEYNESQGRQSESLRLSRNKYILLLLEKQLNEILKAK